MRNADRVATEPYDREFSFTPEDFETVRQLLKERTGISLSDRKTHMMYSRLARRLRATGFTGFADYIAFLKTPDGSGELGFLINAMTTNLTRFYREGHHFDHLMETAIPEAIESRRQSGNKRLRFWSAGCSSGQEPYTIAACIQAVLPDRRNWDVKILATDLDTDMLNRGRRGIYPLESLNDMPPVLRQALKDGGSRKINEEEIAIGPKLKEMIHFKQLNFQSRWPLKGPFDAIFCRNVMIYFDDDFKGSICERMVDLLAPRSYFYIGHAESLMRLNLPVRGVGGSTYQKMN